MGQKYSTHGEDEKYMNVRNDETEYQDVSCIQPVRMRASGRILYQYQEIFRIPLHGRR